MDIGKEYDFWGRCILKAIESDPANGCIWFEHVSGEQAFSTHKGRIPIGAKTLDYWIKMKRINGKND